MGHGCGVSQYHQFYGKIRKKYQNLPRPYVGSYSGEMGHQFLQENLILAWAKSIGTFVMVSISDMLTIKYWQNLGTIMETAKENIHKQFRIGDTCFT